LEKITKELTIKEQLTELADEKYRVFTSALTPGRDHILGVRLPLLRKLAARIAKGDWQDYLKNAEDDTLEEVMLQGMVIGNIKEDIETVLKLCEKFIPKIDCWSICDSFCGGLKITGKHRERVWNFLQPYLNSEREYEIRFGVVMLLGYYVLPEYCAPAFECFNKTRHDGYYVKMAVAWAVSIYFIKYPEDTLGFLRENDLDDFTYNKALQKITESRRVDEDTRIMIRGMKRK
jgi:3-methyladenine DNA glycosylase AlkD